ncbi:hypothetical protein [Nocardia suismassiliense]|uniref:hypothetical protein n=1 Tax=Nocardia suismassiliense TaxID=2077092 RepID=UPI001F1CF702|nr:hypothetical protein [Nocardia suismassiliense]
MIPTFKSFVEGLSGERADQPRQVLWYDYQLLIEHRVGEIHGDLQDELPELPPERIKRLANKAVADSIMRAHFGDVWFERMYEATNLHRHAQGFFYPEGQNEYLDELTNYRKQELARRVHQLQFADWFGLVHDAVKKDYLSGVAFELDVALYLMNYPLNVERRDASLAAGRDFDLSFWITVPPKAVEVKTKEDSTPFNARTVSKTVKTASGQIPEGQSGFLFLRLPPPWVGPGLEDAYHEYLADALTSTDPTSTRYRISAVFSAVDKIYGRPGNIAVSRVWDLFIADHCLPEDWTLALRLKQLYDANLTYMAPSTPF